MSRIALVLTSRFPSEKAYAVTTIETARAAESMGIRVQIYAPSDSGGKPVANVTNVENKLIRKLSPILGRGPAKLGASVFLLRRILIAAEFKRIWRGSNSPDLIVWTRDPIVALLTVGKMRVFLEIHNKPSLIDGFICRLLDGKQSFAVGTLTIRHRDLLRKYFLKSQIAQLPMAVSTSFFLSREPRVLLEKIGYVGKGWSSGEDNKLTEIIHSAKLVDNELMNHVQWEFLGLEPTYKSNMESVTSSYKWKNSEFIFVAHVDHDEVPKYLSEMSIGLIPYHDSEYNRQRFPIKALEYAAAGVTILATDTPGNRSVLSNDFCYFYSPNQVESLAETLLSILRDYEHRDQKRENARGWARLYSYKARVEIVLLSLDGSNGRSSNN